MKVYVLVDYFDYEGYGQPEYVFDSMEKAEDKMVALLDEYDDRILRIFELEVK